MSKRGAKPQFRCCDFQGSESAHTTCPVVGKAGQLALHWKEHPTHAPEDGRDMNTNERSAAISHCKRNRGAPICTLGEPIYNTEVLCAWHSIL